jgi:hypothetical protein
LRYPYNPLPAGSLLFTDYEEQGHRVGGGLPLTGLRRTYLGDSVARFG